MFPYLADSEDVLKPSLFVNQAVFSDFYIASVSRIEYWKRQLLYDKKVYPNDENPFGHASSKAIADPNVLKEFYQKLSKKEPKTPNAFERTINLSYPRSYLEKISNLCKANNVELLFLYLPSFGAIEFQPKEMETYKKYGSILIPPATIFNDKNHWSDKSHINEAGGRLNSFWFANEFATYLKKRKKR